MVERIVLLKLKPEFSNPEKRREIAAASITALRKVPVVRKVNAGVAADDKTAGAWDILLKIWFESAEDIPGYIQDPAHRTFVDDYLKPMLDCIKTWNFEPVTG